MRTPKKAERTPQPRLNRHLKHLQFENDSWKRLLGFILDENTHLKNRLSEVLKDEPGNDLLDDLDSFHEQFLKEDQLLQLLRNNVAEADQLLAREVFEDGMILREVENKTSRLRHEISVAEKQFANLKSTFNSFLAENI